jgi:hypothetical protein
LPKAKTKIKSASGGKSKAAADDIATPDDALFRAGVALAVIRSRFETVCSVAVGLEDSGADSHSLVAMQAVAEKGIRECAEAIKTLHEARKAIAVHPVKSAMGKEPATARKRARRQRA